jgi:hypothetical protein
MLKTQGDMAGALREFRAELANNPSQQAAIGQVTEVEGQLAAHPQTGKP